MNDYGGSSDVGATGREPCAYGDYLNDVKDFATNYCAGGSRFEKVLDELKIVNAPEAQVLFNSRMEGAAHMIRVINKERPTFLAKISRFDDIIDDVESGCKFDCTFRNGRYSAFAEFKSYQASSLASFLSTNSSTYKQFKTYLSNISSVDELRYYFDVGKINDINIIKARFRNVLQGPNGPELIETMSSTFKSSLLVADDAVALTSSQIETILDNIIKLE